MKGRGVWEERREERGRGGKWRESEGGNIIFEYLRLVLKALRISIVRFAQR